MRSESALALFLICAPAVAGCSGAGQSSNTLPSNSLSETSASNGSFVAAQSSALQAVAVSTSGAISASSSSGCPHFTSNPVCHTLPAHPNVSRYSGAWAALEFQSGRAYVPGFSTKPGGSPYYDSRDNSDPPLDELKSGGASISATIACDARSYSAWTCSAHHIGGKTIKLPSGFQPAGNSDHHYSFNDDAGQQEYDFWLVENLPSNGGKLHMGGGGVCPWSGDGTGCSGSNATNIAGSLGSISEADFVKANTGWHGSFGHAIALQALCTDPSHVYPADASDGSTSNGYSACAGHTGANARPPEGTRVFLDMSDDQVNAMNLPAYNRAWWRTMDREHEGGFINDTTWSGGPGFSASYQRDDFSAQARQAGVNPVPYANIPINLGSIDMKNDIKFCANGTC